MYRRKDTFYARAKATGYRSRAAFKLMELAQRHRLVRRGDRVVDLGAWPGGWLQVAAELVGPTGRVVGVDLQPIEPLSERTVVTFTGDIADLDIQQRIVAACGGPADVVLSDVSPKLTGVRARDEAQAQALADTVLECAQRVLRPGGSLVIKMFMSDALRPYVARLRALFNEVRSTRPEATRKASAEMYVIASGFRPQRSPES